MQFEFYFGELWKIFKDSLSLGKSQLPMSIIWNLKDFLYPDRSFLLYGFFGSQADCY